MLTGGDASLVLDDKNKSEYQLIVEDLIKEAKKINDEGTYFPIMGTCLGFQSLIIELFGIDKFTSI